jgi:hypothetical protein
MTTKEALILRNLLEKATNVITGMVVKMVNFIFSFVPSRDSIPPAGHGS